MADRTSEQFDFDFIVVGSGFGGSVAALRLAEKGYSVAVLERGKRWRSTDFPKSNWNLRKFLWAPLLRCFGIQAITRAARRDDSARLRRGRRQPGVCQHAAGSARSHIRRSALEQAGALERRPGRTLRHGAADARRDDGALSDRHRPHAARIAVERGRGETYHATKVGVFFGEPGKTVPDPYFDGQGPERAGCTECGGCMVGCRHNAKNTLDKNYLYLAEKLGVQIIPETEVLDVRESPHGGYDSRNAARSPTGSSNGAARCERAA